MNILRSLIRHKRFLAFLLFCFLVVVPVAQAQSQESFNNFIKANQTGQNSKQRFDLKTSEDVTHWGLCAVAGCPEVKGYEVGAIGATGNMIAGIYGNPPASGAVYAMDVLQRFNPVQPAYAQTGTGFNALSPILPVWKVFRNFAYVMFAVVFIVIGLAVMFRMKLDPRTTITIQSAIPRIVVAILLVTFSYPIAGFMIDFMYILISLVAVLFGSVPGFLPTLTIQDEFLNGGFGQVVGKMFVIAAGAVWSGIQGVGVASGIASALGALGGYLAAAGSASAGPFALLGAALPALILLLIMLWLMFKLFFELLKAYIFIVLAVVLGPLQIALGVIPGVPGFGSWLKNLFANILVFPAVAFVLLLGQVIVNLSTQGLWIAPMLSGNALLTGALPLLLGLGILLIVNQVPQVIKNLMGIKGLGFAVGDNLEVGEEAAKGAGLYGAARYADRITAAAPGGAAPARAQVIRRMLKLRP